MKLVYIFIIFLGISTIFLGSKCYRDSLEITALQDSLQYYKELVQYD